MAFSESYYLSFFVGVGRRKGECYGNHGSPEWKSKALLPDEPIFCCTPEGVGPHGSCSNTLDSVFVIPKHMDGLFNSQVMDMHLGISSPSNEYPILCMWQELWKSKQDVQSRDLRITRAASYARPGHSKRSVYVSSPRLYSRHQRA